MAVLYMIGKNTARGWEQNDDVSTLMLSLGRNSSDTGIADEQLRKRLLEIPLAFLEFETALSRHTIVRARRGPTVRYHSLQLIDNKRYGGEGGILLPPFLLSDCDSYTFAIIGSISADYKRFQSCTGVSIVSLIRYSSAENGISGISPQQSTELHGIGFH